ncbi:hypothetical protein [Streptomyces sp. 6-11-2]|uniref:hypothetical protein n=1 Tax=Streptomyces sp. 6-11-2 TaxID=2585753 RepID=UPI0011412BB1|nr:hypothetical protein [Streptomyces sp. 6-11-2]GED90547.1 hypothetical protein TNCT6_76320 [Streptomyces sp. 6-11-2]
MKVQVRDTAVAVDDGGAPVLTVKSGAHGGRERGAAQGKHGQEVTQFPSGQRIGGEVVSIRPPARKPRRVVQFSGALVGSQPLSVPMNSGA